MNSGNPSSKKPMTATKPSRLPAPSTLRKPTVIPISSLTQSGIKRPAPSGSSVSQFKFKRTTPLSLARNKMAPNRAYTGTKPTATTRLNFNENLIKTPLLRRADAPFRAINENSNETPKNCEKILINRDAEQDAIFESAANRKSESKVPIQTVTVATSPLMSWSVMSKDSDQINSYKSKILLLEKQIDEMMLKNSKVRIENEMKETRIKSELNARERELARQREEITAAVENENRLKNEFEEYKSATLEQANLFEKQQLEYEKTINGLRDELAESSCKESGNRSALNAEILKLKHRINEVENELQLSKSEATIYKEHIEELKSRQQNSDQLRNELREAEKENDRLRDQIKSLNEAGQLKEIMKDEIAQYGAMKDENVHLRNQLEALKEFRSENMILKEKLHTTEDEISTLKRLISEKNVDLAEINRNQERLEQWPRIFGADSAEIVLAQIEQLKKENAMLRLETESLKVEVENRNANSSFQAESAASTSAELQQARMKIDHLNKTLLKRDRKCSLLAIENESYKSVINRYESDITINFEDSSRKRLSELETLVSEYKSITDQQDRKLIEMSEEMLSIASKNKQIQELQSQLATKTSTAANSLQTSHVPFRVIHLASNPFTMKMAEITGELDALRNENLRLKSLVEVLETGDVADMTRQINEGMQSQQEVKSLRQKVDKLKRHHETFCERYKQLSHSFRQACYQLTGYRIDFIGKNRYRLEHMYDQKPKLIFEVEKAKISMLQDGAEVHFADKVDTYLTKGDSCPAFLAAITLELFDKNVMDKNSFSSSFSFIKS